MHSSLPEESTVGFMDLLCPTAGGFCSRADPGGLPDRADQEVKGSKSDLGTPEQGRVLQILMPHHIRCSSPVSTRSCDPACLLLTRGDRAVGCPELGGSLPFSAQVWLGLAPWSGPALPGRMKVQRDDVVPW